MPGFGRQGLLLMASISLGPSASRRDALTRRIRMLPAATHDARH